jgi:hypothetical protein
MRFRLRSLHLVLLVTGISLGVGLPAREAYSRWKTVGAIRTEFHAQLVAASSLSRECPEQAICEMNVLREYITRAPILPDHERDELIEQLELQLAQSRRDLIELEQQWKAMDTSCAIDDSHLQDDQD